MPDRRGGELTAAIGGVVGEQLACLEAQRLVTVDHALGLAGGARGERDQRRRAGIGGQRAGHRLVGEQVLEIDDVAAHHAGLPRTHHPDDGDVGAQLGVKTHPAEPLGGDEDPRLARGQDEAQLSGAVEVHDGHHHRAQERRGPERRGGLHPVRQLQRDHVAGADPAVPQARCQSAGDPFHVAEISAPRPDLRVHLEPDFRLRGQPGGEQVTEGFAGPPTLLFVAPDQVGGNLSHGVRDDILRF